MTSPHTNFKTHFLSCPHIHGPTGEGVAGIGIPISSAPLWGSPHIRHYMELRGELHEISFWLLYHSFVDRYQKSSYYVPGDMQDVGNTAANTTNDILIGVELLCPCLFQFNNPENCWLIECKLMRKYQDLQSHRFFFLLLWSQYIPLSYISLFFHHPD